ncbi:MAG: MiaB/RimO family radical SAM methylthiotransferase [Verrucomicrobia bacterium]|jgi:threonylcarbamoyladenosine tRNA methylthiotransferase MtaB|nr:MiaB/RimO family radical SAM methylthiotransferase [Verrucomicrobiota bacterium]
MQNAPTVSFKTVGCRLNQAETAQIASQFVAAGYRVVEAGQACDVAVVNSCTITHGAERDCARWARRLRRQGARHVILAGCAVVQDGDRLQQETGVDLIADQTAKFNLIELLHGPNGILPAPTAPLPASDHSGAPVFAATRALVKAQDGCNFRCSYCIVPDARGLPRSRPLPDVLDDVRRLADEGFREIVITGANIGCYREGKHDLVSLLEAAESVEGIERIRISSIESTTVERDVIDFMAASAKLCHFLHLPLQSGDNDTLRRMGRRYTTEQYRDVARYAVDRVPDLGLGTDVIVGFPGETDSAFENTLACVRDLPFSNLHVFSYSQRRGTPAAGMPNQVVPEVKKVRSAALIALGKAKRIAFAEAFIGREVNTLLERVADDGSASGWSGQYLPIRITKADAQENDIVTFRPTSTDGDILVGMG